MPVSLSTSAAVLRAILPFLVAVSVLGGGQSNAAAQGAPDLLSAEYRKCLGVANQTNYGFDQCSQAEIKRQAQRMDQAWAAVQKEMRDYGTAGIDALQREQQAWVTFKDASCDYFYRGDFGREGKTYHFGMCKATVIAERVIYLQNLLEFLKAG